jgi:hypothetical protein
LPLGLSIPVSDIGMCATAQKLVCVRLAFLRLPPHDSTAFARGFFQ